MNVRVKEEFEKKKGWLIKETRQFSPLISVKYSITCKKCDLTYFL